MDANEQVDFVIEPSSKVEFASNYFVNVPVILQYENMPLVQCFQGVSGPRTLRCNVFSAAGDLLAVMKGTQLYKTADGEKAGLKMLHMNGATVCELNGRELLVARRNGPAAVAIEAELHTFDGSLINCRTGVEGYINAKDQGSLQIGGHIFRRNLIMGSPIGVLVYSNGSVAMGASYSRVDDSSTDIPEIVVRELGLLNRKIQTTI